MNTDNLLKKSVMNTDKRISVWEGIRFAKL